MRGISYFFLTDNLGWHSALSVLLYWQSKQTFYYVFLCSIISKLYLAKILFSQAYIMFYFVLSSIIWPVTESFTRNWIFLFNAMRSYSASLTNTSIAYISFWMLTAITAQLHIHTHGITSSKSLGSLHHLPLFLLFFRFTFRQLQTVSLLSRCIEEFSFFCQSSPAHSFPPLQIAWPCHLSNRAAPHQQLVPDCKALLTARLCYLSV